MRPGALPAALVVVASLAQGAGANGRPPVSNGIFFQPGNARSIYVRSTFGLLVSHDEGCSFRWVCEQAIGYGGTFDPKYAVAADGTLFATTFEGLRVSRDGGCTWTTATEDKPAGDPGRFAGIWVDALDVAANGDVWVATAESGLPNNVYRSTDGGRTFEPRNMLSQTVWWKSVQVAPTDAQRVYVTGYEVAGQTTAHFLRSSDAGAQWTPSPLTGVMFGATPVVYASAVDPANAEIVFLTSVGANPPTGDRLYRSTDGGTTFQEALATSSGINDVVFHGGKVLVATVSGSFQSADGGATFAPLPNAPQLACLGSHGGQLLGCGANWQPDFKSIARSMDSGGTWDKMFRFVELAGPLACGAGTTAQQLCEPMWPGLQQQFGATGPTLCAAPQGDPPVAPPKNGGGCCDSGGAGGPLGAAALAAWLGLVMRRRRRG